MTASAPAGRDRAELMVAALLFVLGFTATFVAPQRLALVFTIIEARTLSEVVIPVVFWGAIALGGVYLSRARGTWRSRAQPRESCLPASPRMSSCCWPFRYRA